MKKLIVKTIILILSVGWFVLLHFKFKFIMKYPAGWTKITAYCIGVGGTYPIFLAHIFNGEKPENAFILSFLGSGAGTVFSWMLEDGIK